MSIHAIDATDRWLPEVQSRMRAQAQKQRSLEDVVSLGNQAGFNERDADEGHERPPHQSQPIPEEHPPDVATRDNLPILSGTIINITG